MVSRHSANMRQIFSLLLLVSMTLAASAQQAASKSGKSQPSDLGWTSSMNFEGNVDSSQRVFDLNSSVGYNFSQHWGADLGVPFEFVTSTSTTTTTSGNGAPSTSSNTTSSLNSIGNVFTDLRYSAKSDIVNYSSTLMGSAPTGSKTNGISTGRATVGWNNHLEHEFGFLTPFIEAGFGNSVMDSRLNHRPFTTLGFVSQFAAGTSIDLGHNFSIGASLYDVLPSGQQKLYSKLVGKGSGKTAGKGNHGRAYELAAETVGTSSLTRDNGDSAWVDYSPGALDFQVGYTHSVHYAYNTFAFSAGVNLGKLMRKASGY
jgi:hypothetical protein